MARLTPSRVVTLALIVIGGFVYYGLGPDTAITDKLEGYRKEVNVGLDFAPDGLLHGWDEAHRRSQDPATSRKERRALEQLVKRHPIEVLMEKGEREWQEKLAR
jgi:hypothetical protein